MTSSRRLPSDPPHDGSTTVVSVAHVLPAEYPATPPFDPSEAYPELGHAGSRTSQTENSVYAAVRRSLLLARLDEVHANSDEWNPLGDLVTPGFQVLVKPNLVFQPGGQVDGEALITHPSVLRPILDYVCLALQGKGSVLVADSPLQSADFGRIVEFAGLSLMLQDCAARWGVDVSLLDLRREISVFDRLGRFQGQAQRAGDPQGYSTVDLGISSALEPVTGESGTGFRITDYDLLKLHSFHRRGTHKYVIANSVLASDAVICVPKLKVHKKAGMTGALKNLVGTVGLKECLPHHRAGAPADGGDEYPRRELALTVADALMARFWRGPSTLSGRAARLAAMACLLLSKRVEQQRGWMHCREGNWSGNDTIWRTVADLNRIALYADKHGVMHNDPQRGYFAIVDAVVGGDKDGPLHPEPVHAGLIVAGHQALWVDWVCASLMGFVPARIPLLPGCLGLDLWPLTDQAELEVRVRFDDGRALSLLDIRAAESACPFRPCKNWESILTETSRDSLIRRRAGQDGSTADGRSFTEPERSIPTAGRGDDNEDLM